MTRRLNPLSHLEIVNRCRRGASYKDVGSDYGMTRGQVSGIVHRYRQNIEQDDLLLDVCSLIDEGLDNRQIVHALRVSCAQVAGLRRALEKIV